MIEMLKWCVTTKGSTIPLYASDEITKLHRPILIMGGVHGDEPEGIRLAQELLMWLKLQKNICPWILIPCLNVDGAQGKIRQNANGVDLNRNYPASNWSAKVDNPRYHPGPSAASELEIKAVVSIIQKVNPRLMIHCHSWHPCIVGTGNLAAIDSQRLAKSSGYKFVDEIGYPTPGSLSSYGWHTLGIPVICIEEQDHLKDHNTIWPRFENGFREIFYDLGDRL